MHPLVLPLAGLALAAFTISYAVRAIEKRNAKFNPRGLPGPWLVPWVGRIHDLPINYMWLKFKEWADIYGPIYRTKMLGANVVIVSDETIAEEILVKRARNYSDRPTVQSLVDSKSTHGSMEYLPLMGKNMYWARQRKLTHSLLIEATNLDYRGVMEFETKRWLNVLLNEPDNFCYSLEDFAAKIMCTLAWDDHSLSDDCNKSAWGLLEQMSPAGPITNVLTPLWHIPEIINPWKKAERIRHDTQQVWWMERLTNTRRLMEKGEQRPCFSRKFLETAEKTTISGDKEASNMIGMAALVGIFTVAGPLFYFLVAMIHHPEWQRKCQEEIDSVLQGRAPTVADKPQLPILRACLKETMRWRPNVPTGVAHECEADDWYKGFYFPKGTRIVPLDYAFLRNEQKYPDPESFRPERWLEAGWPTFQEPLTKFPSIKGMTSFGWGQRKCLGQALTEDELVVGCGGLMWAFNLKKKVDVKTGLELEVPTDKSNSLLIIKPDPFEMAFEPRSVERKAQVQELWREAQVQDAEERRQFLKAADGEKTLI